MRRPCFLLLLALTACGTTPRRTTPVEAPSSSARRANGLAVHTLPRLGAGVVAIHLRLPAGSLDETPDDAGAAHAAARWVLGDRLRGLQEAVERLGGVARAWTDREATAFEIVVAADQLAPSLKLLAQAIGEAKVDADGWAALLRRLDAEQLQARKSDARRALEVSVADLFDAHPFARAPLPDSVALRRLKASRIDAYIERRYRPDGAVLVLAGDLGDAPAAAVDAAFAGWKGRVAHVQQKPITPPGDLNVRVVGTRSADATIALTFLADAPTPEAAATLDLLGAALEDRVGAALARIGVERAPRALVAAPGGAGFVTVIAEVPAQRVDAAWRALIPAIVREAGAPWSDAHFKALKARIDGIAEALDGSLEGEAGRHAANRARWPDRGADAWREGLALTGPAELADAEKRLLRLERATAVILAPDAIRTDDDGPWIASLTEQAARLARPDGGLGPGRHALAEGFEAIVHPMAGARQVGIAIWLAGGANAVRPEHAGLAALVARGLARPVAGEPVVEARAEADGIRVWCEAPAAELDATLRLLARRITGLQWTAAEVEAVREAPPRDLEGLLAQAAGVDLEGTPETLGRLTPATVERWYAAHVREAPMIVSLAGAVDRRALGGLAQRFGQRRAAAKGEPAAPKANALASPTDAAIGQAARRWPAPGDQRAALTLAFATLLAPDSSTRAALATLGAQAEARLEGLSATLSLTAPAARFAAADKALIKGLDALRTLPIDGDLLAQVRLRLAARLRVRLRRPTLRAAWLLDQARAGLPHTGADALDGWIAALEATAPDAVAKAAREGMSRARQIEVQLLPRPKVK